ncbi:MAG TPA: TauD/TfdA family dioxygenase [Paucimonas sp.]|nr:TauD/TfdA family dioxygenase [Paucimonas sp.]
MKITPQTGRSIGATITDVDLRNLNAEESEAIKNAVYRHRVVTIKGQNLAPREFIAFGNTIGQVQIYPQKNYHHPDFPEIFVSSNVQRDGKKMGVDRTGGYWHTDTAFMPEPHIFTLLSPQMLPRMRRTTLFIDMAAAYRNLPDDMRAILDRSTGLNSGRWHYKVRAEDVGTDIAEILATIDRVAPPARHPAVITHPVTGEKSLYMSSGFTIGLEGAGADTAGTLLPKLFEMIEAEENVQEAVWDLGDIIVWDNRLVCHRSGRLTEALGATSTDGENPDKTMMFRLTAFDSHPLSAGQEARPSLNDEMQGLIAAS